MSARFIWLGSWTFKELSFEVAEAALKRLKQEGAITDEQILVWVSSANDPEVRERVTRALTALLLLEMQAPGRQALREVDPRAHEHRRRFRFDRTSVRPLGTEG